MSLVDDRGGVGSERGVLGADRRGDILDLSAGVGGLVLGLSARVGGLVGDGSRVRSEGRVLRAEGGVGAGDRFGED